MEENGDGRISAFSNPIVNWDATASGRAGEWERLSEREGMWFEVPWKRYRRSG
jgi:hypothetical protein